MCTLMYRRLYTIYNKADMKTNITVAFLINLIDFR